MFRLLRGLHRRGLGQAGVSCVPAPSGATSTRTWTGRRRLCSGYFGSYICEKIDRQASLMFELLRGLHGQGHGQVSLMFRLLRELQVSLMLRLLRGATSARAWTRLCSGYFAPHRRRHGQSLVFRLRWRRHRRSRGDDSPSRCMSLTGTAPVAKTLGPAATQEATGETKTCTAR